MARILCSKTIDGELRNAIPYTSSKVSINEASEKFDVPVSLLKRIFEQQGIDIYNITEISVAKALSMYSQKGVKEGMKILLASEKALMEFSKKEGLSYDEMLESLELTDEEMEQYL